VSFRHDRKAGLCSLAARPAGRGAIERALRFKSAAARRFAMRAGSSAAVLFAESADAAVRVHFHRTPRSPCRCRIRAPRRFVAAAGWTALVAYALAESLPGAVTHDFIDYITSDRILVGAEIEKIIAILSVTVILALAIARARGLLIRLVAERSAAHELSRFFDPGIAARIP
jgi:hypothetical protein